jgi:hypothetical protein
MHVHANPINLNAQLDSLYSAQKAEAKKEAANIRKKLSEFASELAGEADGGEGAIVKLGAREESEEQTPPQKPQDAEKKRGAQNAGDAASAISDWA